MTLQSYLKYSASSWMRCCAACPHSWQMLGRDVMVTFMILAWLIDQGDDITAHMAWNGFSKIKSKAETTIAPTAWLHDHQIISPSSSSKNPGRDLCVVHRRAFGEHFQPQTYLHPRGVLKAEPNLLDFQAWFFLTWHSWHPPPALIIIGTSINIRA